MTDTATSATETHAGLVVEQQAFFASMSAFPTGVTVVTTLDENGGAIGLTCNAFMSVSAEPPLVLVSVDRTSNTLPAVRQAGRFVVNFLAAGRDEIARMCATKRTDKFVDIPWRPSDHVGLPILHEDAIAHVVCDVKQEIEAGDHVLLLGLVQEAHPPAESDQPLVYFRRTFHTWPAAAAEVPLGARRSRAA